MNWCCIVKIKMASDLAPIGVSAYVRLQHLQQNIAALQRNGLAEQSDLFVFSDAARPGDEAKVAAVRSYLMTIDGFKNVCIVEREKNGRTENNRGGLRLLLNRFGKVIFLEEDVVAAPGFLKFMNQALDKYAENKKVFSVVGYCPPIKIPADYPHDVFFLKRCNAWGLGIWKDRYDRIRYITPDEYEQFSADTNRVREFVNGGGEDLMVMLKADAYGKIDAGDVKAMYAQFLSDQYTVYPCKSLTSNMGFDGTGTYCASTTRFNVLLSPQSSFSFPDDVVVDQRIVESNRQFRAIPSYSRRLMEKWRGICQRYLKM
jgi:hypothetical protein